MYEFTQDWFSNSDVFKLLSNYLKPANVNQMLEIGSFELDIFEIQINKIKNYENNLIINENSSWKIA